MINSGQPKVNVLGISVDAIDMDDALDRVLQELESERKGYVCLAGVHGVMEARRNIDLANIYAAASLVVPDGMPMVWVGRQQGHRWMERVAGPDLMLEVMRCKEFRGYTHFLCGGKQGIAEELSDKLQRRFPFTKILGTYAPPFGAMSADEDNIFLDRINTLRPDIVWVGISTPKQERFMARYLPLLETKLMFGVGAAFDFHTGHIADCADWIKQSGLQWVHRLVQDPKHLWRRYLRNNPAFIYAMAMQLTGQTSCRRSPRSDGAVQLSRCDPTVSLIKSELR